MTRAFLVLLALVGGFAHSAGAPVVRVAIQAKQQVLAGQQVKVDVLVLVPNFFMSAPKWPVLDIPGAVVTLSEGAAQNVTETIGGESYAGIQQTYLVVPQQAGEFTIPPARITFQYAAEPGKAKPGSVTLPAKKFIAKLPAGAQSAGAPTPVARVTLTQQVERGQALKAGDTLVRTVSAFAENTQAMMILPPRFDAPPGVRVYPHDPALTDVTKDRVGFVGGRRVDRVTYVFEGPGDYTLPGIEIKWFNAATGKETIASVPEIKVSVAPNPSFKPGIAPEAAPIDASAPPARARNAWKRWLPWAAGVVAAGLAGAWLLRRYRPRYLQWRAGRRLARQEGEPAYFARLQQACHANDALRAYQALGAWTRRAGKATIASWVAEGDGEALRSEVSKLERYLFADGASSSGWDGRALSAACTSARRQSLAPHRRGMPKQHALPALNP